MIPVPMVDLQALHGPLQDQLVQAASRVLASGHFILGPEVQAFEQELAVAIGRPYAVGVSSGSDALLALLLAAGVHPGDEVVTTPYSFFATAEAIARLGARPVFADVETDTLNLDPEQVLARLRPKTRAVLVVHLFGRPAAMQPLRAACGSRGVVLLEDAAQAVGAPEVGTSAGAAVSFFPAKNLGGFGDAGAVITADAAVAEKVRILRSHGATAKGVHVHVGGNFRLDALQAALLRVKVPFLATWAEARRVRARQYHAALAGLPLALPPLEPASVWNQFVVRVRDGGRDRLAAWLDAAGVASAVYYRTPLHLQPALADLGYRRGDFPVAERAAEEALALPLSPTLTDAQLDRVVSAVVGFFR
ncbi:MAG: DegT/DnrJ/EryC1/StrS family aminotransferase [Polyangia bacterium]